MLLDSLWIRNYRTFRSLRLERLGRVNLFVGRNNTGKSSLLEAVRIFVARGSADVLWRIIRDRDELNPAEAPLENLIDAFSSLFNGREGSWDERSIAIGPVNNDHLTVHLMLSWLNTMEATSIDSGSSADMPDGVPIPALGVTFADISRHLALEEIESWAKISRTRKDSQPIEYVPPAGFNPVHTARLWDSIALTEAEELVTAVLRLVSPEIERISVVGRPRIVMAKVKGYTKPIPLRSMGDGVNRVLGIALCLVNARNGVALFDEFENGLHYAIQRQLWDVVFRTAQELNVQVYAVTHSWDCIEAFQRAARDDHHEDALLVRLERTGSDIRPTLVSERDLSVLTREHIEVR